MNKPLMIAKTSNKSGVIETTVTFESMNHCYFVKDEKND